MQCSMIGRGGLSGEKEVQKLTISALPIVGFHYVKYSRCGRGGGVLTTNEGWDSDGSTVLTFWWNNSVLLTTSAQLTFFF